MRGYSSARMEAGPAPILLNANENPWSAQGVASSGLNRYPEPQPTELIRLMAAYYDVDQTQVLATRGSDEAIDLLVRAFCTAGQDAILECPPCFGMYRVSAQIQDAAVVTSPLGTAWRLDATTLLKRCQPNVKLIFLCSPNNPTGTVAERDDVERICEARSDKSLVVVDEAYQEFNTRPSVVSLLSKFENLAVLRTLSKAFGLAGVRCGALLARPEIITVLRRIMAPYPLPSPTSEAAVAVLQPTGIATMRERVGALNQARARLAERLSGCPEVEEVWVGEANFVLARVSNPSAIIAACADSGIVIRNVSHYAGLDGCVRITVGAPHENAALLAVLESDEAAS